uniref:Uncharacterized protein n=1 Tax=Anguilla anguilla TaxID=7936 RepID=A0A0E9S8S2_ANGAN
MVWRRSVECVCVCVHMCDCVCMFCGNIEVVCVGLYMYMQVFVC